MTDSIRIALLGATGSIGSSTLDLVRRHPERISVRALTANTNYQAMLELCREFQPQLAVMHDSEAAQKLERGLAESGLSVEVQSGAEALCAAGRHAEADTVVAAIVGAAGLAPTLAAVEAGKRILLANKEALVCSGALFMEAVARSGAVLLPVDSEHNAIFQCLQGQSRAGLRRILLTASGGPFLRVPAADLEKVTPEQACAHPNWDMGAKISVDSATMMNKGLELIEARWLFDCPAEQLEVVIHPQSIVHSMVEYRDGSLLAQMSNPDMRVPIAHVLGWPERMESGVPGLDFRTLSDLQFEEPDLEQFPCLQLAMEAAGAGGDLALHLNAANEVAVQAFLRGRINFPQIYRVNARALEKAAGREPESIQAVLEQDKIARQRAEEFVEQLS